jgi:hypothetical protein
VLRPGQARAQAVLVQRQVGPGARALLAEWQVAQALLQEREPWVVQEGQALLLVLQGELVAPRVPQVRQVRRVQRVLAPRLLLPMQCQRLVLLPERRHRCHPQCEPGVLRPRRCRLRPQEWPR